LHRPHEVEFGRPGHAQIRNHCSEVLLLQPRESLTTVDYPVGVVPLGAQVSADLLTHRTIVCHD
jgi:hypothetical protein